jgi:hypothetical protein
MTIKDFKPFTGQHCETTALGNLLQHSGLSFSEPMIFGLGQGLGFIYWDMKKMDFPFIGGRTKPDAVTESFCRLMGIPVRYEKTASPARAWKNVREVLEKGRPVGLKLDCYYLDYFVSKTHFAAHYAAVYGFDEELAYMADTEQQGLLAKTRLSSLAAARAAKGPMATPGLSFSLTPPSKPAKIEGRIPEAIRANAAAYLEAPIRNMGHRGIERMSREVPGWLSRSRNPGKDLALCALLMERGGTGGGLFRKIYADFLAEAGDLLNSRALLKSAADFRGIARSWTEVSDSIAAAGKTGKDQYLRSASELLLRLCEEEKAAMSCLAGI